MSRQPTPESQSRRVEYGTVGTLPVAGGARMPKSDASMTRPVASEPSVLGRAGTSVVVTAKVAAGAEAVKWSIAFATLAFSSRVKARRCRLDARKIAAPAGAFSAAGTAVSRHVDDVDREHSSLIREATAAVTGVWAAAQGTVDRAESAGAPEVTTAFVSAP